MIKLLLLVCVFVAIIFLGFSYYMFFKKKENFYKDLTSFLEFASNEISFNKTTISTIIEKYKPYFCSELKTYLNSKFINKTNNFKFVYLNEEEIVDMDEFFNKFGTCDADTEVLKVKNFSVFANNHLAIAKEKVAKQGMLALKLAIAFAFIVVIIFI